MMNQKKKKHDADEVQAEFNVIKKNELLDSLDLNVGMDALMKLQDVWGKQKKSKIKDVIEQRE